MDSKMLPLPCTSEAYIPDIKITTTCCQDSQQRVGGTPKGIQCIYVYINIYSLRECKRFLRIKNMRKPQTFPRGEKALAYPNDVMATPSISRTIKLLTIVLTVLLTIGKNPLWVTPSWVAIE
jgi:hypothetical protein